MSPETLHDRLWARHPAVSTGPILTRGERAADIMKAALATWAALGLVVIGIIVWILTGGFGGDARPFILLNLCLSCFAALQCFVLLIANRRGEQVAAEIALHTEENTERLVSLMEQNTTLTEEVRRLSAEVHAHVVGS